MAQNTLQKPPGTSEAPNSQARPSSHMAASKPLLERRQEALAPVLLVLTKEEHEQRLQIWELARSGYNYPPLKNPIFYEKLEGGAHIDMRDCQVHMGEAVVREIAATGVPAEAAQRAIEEHEIGHYMTFPKNLAITILAGKMLDDFFPPNTFKHQGFQNYVFQLYADMANDTASVLTPHRREDILGIRSALQSAEQSKTDLIVREIMLSYLYHQAGEKFQLSPQLVPDLSQTYPSKFKNANDEEIEGTYFEKWHNEMLKVDFLNLNVNNMRMSLYVFGKLIEEILDKFPPPKQKGKGSSQQGQAGQSSQQGQAGQGGSGQQGKGKKPDGQEGEGENEEGEGESKEGKGKQNGPLGNPTGMPQDSTAGDIIRKATRSEIDQAMRELSKHITKAEIDRIKDWLGDRNPHKGQKQQSIGIGTSSGELEVNKETVEYYKGLASQYPVIVAAKPMVLPATKKAMGSTERMRMSTDPLLIIPSSSGGRIYPGLTKSVKITEKPKTTTKFDTPHLLVVIDSSGSQPNPNDRKSYSVLAGVCAARSYWAHNSHIGVINFSGDSFFMGYTRDFDEACAGICSFQGGGTVVDVKMIEHMLAQGKNPFGSRKTAQEIAEELKGKSMRDLEGLGLPQGAVRKEVNLNRNSFEKALEGNDIDLLMFTDGGIANLKETLDFFEERAQPNRATIILSGAAGFDNWFDYKSESGRIKIIHVDRESDIPEIAIGQVKDSINRRATSGLLHRR